MAFCTTCGATLADGARYCTTCGAPAGRPPAQEPTPQTVTPSPPVAAAPAIDPLRKRRLGWTIAATLLALALLAASVLAALALFVFTPEKTVKDLATAVNAGDSDAAERLLLPALARDFDESGGILEGLEVSRVGEDADRLSRTAGTLTAATMARESEGAALQLTLRRKGLAWRVESVEHSATETVTEDIETESVSMETEALPSGTTMVVADSVTGSRSVTRERVVSNGKVSDTVLDETILEEPEAGLEWIGTGLRSDYAGSVSRPASGDSIDRSTWIVDDPKSVIGLDATEVAASFSIEPITSDMVFSLVWLKPDGTEYFSPDVYPDPSWSYINVGWWHDDVQAGGWVAALLINGDPAEYVQFAVE